MSEQTLSYDTVIALALRLTRTERAQLIAQLAPTLVVDSPADQSSQSLRGILRGTAPSADEIDAARREMWGEFPHKDDI
ncbi:MAG: hypothetical protein K8S97_15025 [Anaerolineae bacterium]|nr:hypothetical protein [Anaerolineae bacterium]